MKHTSEYPSAGRLLLKAYWRKNKINNFILLFAVGMIVFISMVISSLIPAKINADITNYIRAEGMCADAYVENGTEDLAARIGKIPFVEAAGCEKHVGRIRKEDNAGDAVEDTVGDTAEDTVRDTAEDTMEDAVLGECIVYDEQTFQTMIAPAYPNLVGNYPEKEEEIILSVQMLKQLGVDSPQIGMQVSLTIDWSNQNDQSEQNAQSERNTQSNKDAQSEQNAQSNEYAQSEQNAQSNEYAQSERNVQSNKDAQGNTYGERAAGGSSCAQEFVLSGYYEEGADTAGTTSKAFLSEAVLSRAGMEMYPCRILIQTDGGFLDGEQMAGLLSNELWMWMDPDQYIVANDSAAYQAIRSTIGSYRIGIVWCLCFFLFLFFILYNLKAVSLESDIRSFAMFRTIGGSDREIRRMFRGQTWMLWFVGTAIGSGAGSLVATYILPIVSGSENVPEQMMIRLCVIWLASAVMTAAVSGMVMRKMKKLSLSAAVNYVSNNPPRRTNLQDVVKKRNCRNVLAELAWSGAFRSKKKCIAAICFLVLGCEMILLCIGILSKGAEQMNELKQNPDFTVTVTQNAGKMLSEEEIAGWTEKAKIFAQENGQNVSAREGQIQFNVDRKNEPSVKKSLKDWAQKENAAFHAAGYAYELPLYEITCNSDEIAENEETMAGNRMLSLAVCTFILLAGAAQGIGTTVTELGSRKQEFVLLGQIGMTRKQIRNMLILEKLIVFGIGIILVFLIQGILFLTWGR